jgi:hypothetical protein
VNERTLLADSMGEGFAMFCWARIAYPVSSRWPSEEERKYILEMWQEGFR